MPKLWKNQEKTVKKISKNREKTVKNVEKPSKMTKTGNKPSKILNN